MNRKKRLSDMFKVVWDKENNGVRLTMSPSGEALNVSPRPVFWEELDFLGLDKLGWQYPHSEEPLLWACERRYFYKGELVMEVKGGNVYDKPNIYVDSRFANLELTPIDIERLKEINEDSIFLIEHDAMEFIESTFEKYKNASSQSKEVDYDQLAEKLSQKTKKQHVIIKEDCDSFDIMETSEAARLGKSQILNNNIEVFLVSFSGGKDSQVLLDLVSRVIPASEFITIYSDTGYELPSSLKFYDKVQEFYKSKYPNIRFELAKNHQPVLHYWDEMGSPSNIHRWCCGVMKTAPLYIKLKEIVGKGRQPHVLSFIGTRSDESQRRSNYIKIAKDAKHSNVVNVSPILEWSSTEIWLYILSYSLPFNSAYRKGLGRVGCVTCPFGSDWNDYLCNKLFPNTTSPFLEKLKEFASRNGVTDINDYIRLGNWKIRAGGTGYETKSELSIITINPDFKALIVNPKEDIYQWLKTLGEYNIVDHEDYILYTVKYKGNDFAIKISHNAKSNTLNIEIPNVNGDVFFISHIRRVLNKATYCVNCELCEVECPTGALTVIPIVNINESKCIHCKRCLDFKDNGCITANSIKKAQGLKMESKRNTKTTINRYNNFGFRHKWITYFMNHIDTFFENNDHGLNVNNQLPPFTNWLRDSEILIPNGKKVTELGHMLSKVFSDSPDIVWEIIWINLNHNSEICGWYSENAEYNKIYSKDELEKILEETLPQYSSSVRKNAFGALQNTFVTSPLGENLGIGIVQKINNKPSFIRKAHNDLSLVATAYSLYRYAEKKGRKSFTVSEFYNPEQKEGIVRQFGIEREAFEQNLRSLEADSNHVLRSELKMGLDNIILRDDLASEDILKLML